MNQSTVEEHKALAATVEHAIASGQAVAANAAARAAIAKERVARIRKGEDFSGGLRKRFTSEDAIKILRANGFSPSDIRQMQHVAEISRLRGEEAFEALFQ
jgi:septal ring factor EnvC (AmiA/AmiB activator)